MRYLSLFAGIEAASVAWHPLGWEPAAFAEVDTFCCELLAHYYPAVPNLGDVTKITKEQIEELGCIDVVVFGSPCQDLSVAGRREGMADGTRSSLFFCGVEIARWSKARYALWENVPGAFSTNRGRDFAAVVGSLCGLAGVPVPADGWGTEGVVAGPLGMCEWGVLDAQWFGVAQRRRRVFALLDTGDWAGRPPILLEPEGMRGDPPAREEAGEEVARPVASCPDGGSGWRADADTVENLVVAGTLQASGKAAGSATQQDAEAGLLIPEPGHDPVGTRVRSGMAIRRLTPVECERLQGFPDNYTQIQRGPKRKPTADGPRYRAIGNSMAVPVMRWIGERLQRARVVAAAHRSAGGGEA